MTSVTSTSGDAAHVVTLSPLEADSGFQCRATCSCGDFDRTSTSAKGATQARANARAAFNRHLVKVEARTPSTPPTPTPPTPTPPTQPTRTTPPAQTSEPTEPAEPAEPTLDEPDPPALPQPRTTRRRAAPAVAAIATASLLVVGLVLAVAVALVTARDDSGSRQVAPPTSSPSKAPVEGLPPLPIQVVQGPPKAAFVDLLLRADPVFATYRTGQLEQGGRAVCRDYGRGIGVVEIASTILATSALDSVQAITMIAAAGRTLCPAYEVGISAEVSGLG